MGVQRPDARIVEAGRDGVGLHNLAVVGLHQEGAAAVDDALGAARDGCGRVARVEAVARGFDGHEAHLGVVDEVEERAGGVAASAHAGYHAVGQLAAGVLGQLRLGLFADDALQARHEVGIGMRPHHRADDVERVFGVRYPVAQGLVGGVFQRAVAAGGGAHFGSQHLHAGHVGRLPFYVDLAHVDHALHSHQGADGGRGHAVLSGSGLGYDARLAHLPGYQYLPHGVVDFVGAGVGQVLALEEDVGAVFFGETPGQVERSGAPHIVLEQFAVLAPERFGTQYFEIRPAQILHVGV